MSLAIHPILKESFAIIDREIGENNLSPAEYAIARRVIHSTADFEFARRLKFSPGAIETAIAALKNGVPIVTDVTMVKQGIASTVAGTFKNEIVAAIDFASLAGKSIAEIEALSLTLPVSGQSLATSPGSTEKRSQTRTEKGLLAVAREYPTAIYAIANAPTALLALCSLIKTSSVKPAIVIGAPVGFVSVVESKAVLAQTPVPQIRVEGRKGGSPATAAIINALISLAWADIGDQEDKAEIVPNSQLHIPSDR